MCLEDREIRRVTSTTVLVVEFDACLNLWTKCVELRGDYVKKKKKYNLNPIYIVFSFILETFQ